MFRSNMDKAMGRSSGDKPKGEMVVDSVSLTKKDLILNGKETTAYEVRIMKCGKSDGDSVSTEYKSEEMIFTDIEAALSAIADAYGAKSKESSENSEETDTEDKSEGDDE